MKKTHFLMGLIFAGCSSFSAVAAPVFTGQSYGDQIVRSDVQAMLVKLLHYRHGSNCKKIDRVDAQIISINRTMQDEVIESLENWKVTACNISKTYRISLRPDAKGEMDFNIQLPPK